MSSIAMCYTVTIGLMEVHRYLLPNVRSLPRYVASSLTKHSLTAIVEIFTGIYGFSVGIGGLAYIGLGVGFMSATIFGAYFADRVYASVCALSAVAKPVSLTEPHLSWQQKTGARASPSTAFRRSCLAPCSYRSASCAFLLH